MSKYNYMESVPIESIPEEEIQEAIKEWAEGDHSMEELLWTCYKKGIKTDSCHAGARPYISFIDQDDFQRINGVLEVAQKTKGAQILLETDGGNPFSGPTWDVPTILIGHKTEYQEEADEFFDQLNESLQEENHNSKTHVIFRLLDFFKGKESSLLFRIIHEENDELSFYIESGRIPDDRYHAYDEIFQRAGMIPNDDPEVSKKRHSWKIMGDSQEDFNQKLENVTEYITKEYAVEKPQREEDIITFNTLARFKKKNMSPEEFNDWIYQKKIEYGLIEEKNNELNQMLNENEQTKEETTNKTKEITKE